MRTNFIIFSIILSTFISCKKYNFNYYLDEGYENISIKGQIDENQVPNGDFIFYSDLGNVEAEGNYSEGYKSGVWKYYFNKKRFEIEWKTNSFLNLKFSLPSSWTLKIKDSIFYAYQMKEQEVSDKFMIDIHDLSEFNGSSENFIRAFKSDMEINFGHKGTIIDLTNELKNNFDLDNVALFNSAGISIKENVKLYWFSFLFQSIQKNKIIEISYMTRPKQKDFKNKLFNDIIIDLHIQDTLVLKKRWGIVN